jgi:hypothetical protein
VFEHFLHWYFDSSLGLTFSECTSSFAFDSTTLFISSPFSGLTADTFSDIRSEILSFEPNVFCITPVVSGGTSEITFKLSSDLIFSLFSVLHFNLFANELEIVLGFCGPDSHSLFALV